MSGRSFTPNDIWECVTDCWGDAGAWSAVVGLFDAGGRTLLLATTSDLSAFLSKRLGDDAGAGRDLRGVCTHVGWVRVSSALEGDLVFMRVARELAPRQHRAAADRLRAWFVRFDPDDDTPMWRKTNLGDAPEGDDPALYLGPASDKHAAARLGELIDDLFELCRFPRELARAPCGTACAYKEMGRCPAACDGSESLGAYRARAAESVAFVRTARGERTGAWQAQMRAHAEARRFEDAKRVQERVERAQELEKKRGLAWASTLADLWLVGVTPGVRRGWARVLLIAPGGWRHVADVRGKGLEVGELEEAVRRAARDVPAMRFAPEQVEDVGVVGSHLYRPGKRRGGYLRLGPDGAVPDRDELVRLIRSACGADATKVDEHEIEALP